ncbi:hypothetical protein N8I77_001956 [Diaporthe amygdali]|uniref:Uncharacterized protein n=1 Tax=Phomopsis amygdali TaxID=1214568 RepID=A0AAD9STT8_PHOAM|nr:hypothetical protein N8I77_001956 [Diaporthe amygdali]
MYLRAQVWIQRGGLEKQVCESSWTCPEAFEHVIAASVTVLRRQGGDDVFQRLFQVAVRFAYCQPRCIAIRQVPRLHPALYLSQEVLGAQSIVGPWQDVGRMEAARSVWQRTVSKAALYVRQGDGE